MKRVYNFRNKMKIYVNHIKICYFHLNRMNNKKIGLLNIIENNKKYLHIKFKYILMMKILKIINLIMKLIK